MEEAYASAAGAVSRLVLDTSGEDQYPESKAVLQSVLHRRPVVLGFVVCTLAAKLKGAAWTRSANSVPHTGICYALEALLASYDPSTPNSISPVIDALGDEGSKALLYTSRDTALSLPWAHRLCLLHACLAEGGTRGGRGWGWLPTAADSACSQALQAVTKCGTSNTNSSTGKGKERARAAVVVGGHSVVGRRTIQGGSRGVYSGGGVSSSVVLRICSELAMGGTAIHSPSLGPSFLSGLSQGAGARSEQERSLPGGYVLREQGEDWLQGFLFKLHALRDAILRNAGGGDDDQGDARVAEGGTVAYGGDGGMAAHGADVLPEVVERALERSHCGEAFIRAVQAALEAEQTPMTARDGHRKRKFTEGLAGSVQLKSALEVCLFGARLPGEQGLVDVLSDENRPESIETNSAMIGVAAAAVAVSTPASAPKPIHGAHTFLRCLVTGGVRVRDLLLSLLHLQRVYGQSSNPDNTEPFIPVAGKRAAATIALRVQRDARRGAVAELLKSLVEWLAESVWAWSSVEEYAGDRRWEDDLAAAAIVVTNSVAFGAGTSSGVTAAGAEPSGVLLDGGWRYRRDLTLGGDVYNRGIRGSITDPIDLLDRLVAVSAAAQAAQNLSWVDVVERMVAIAKTGPVCAYAAACVERSVALGGQASFPMVEEQRLLQVGGRELWRLLEQACALRRESGVGGRARVVLIRTAVAAVISCREASGSGMISPGMMKSSPIRLVIDMIKAACGTVSIADVMSGLLSRSGDEGPALAADMFAAIVGSETAVIAAGGSGCCDAGDENLREQTVQWLSKALSSARTSPGRPTGFALENAIAAVSLIKSLSKRVPYETKTVLTFVCKAAESSCRDMISQRLNYADQAVSGRSAQQCAHKCGDNDPLEALMHVAQAAMETPLLPLPVPLLSPSLFPEEEGGAAPGAEGAAPAGDGAGGAARKRRQAAAEATAGLLLDAFMQSPGVVQRAIRAALQRGNCSHELLAVQRALRVALCTQPGAAVVDGSSDDDGNVIPPGLGSRRADACLLMGHFVELGAPGWAEAKAAMDPPPPQLVAAAEMPFGKKIVDDSSQRPTALRLELWLRNLLRDCDADLCHGSREPGEFSFPDVFRTARTLAQAVSRHGSAIIMGGSHVTNGPVRFHAGNGSFVYTSPHPRQIQRENEHNSDNSGALAPPRRALAGRLGSVPAVGALQSWVSGVVKTAARYKRWLPWQAFSDELRQLVLLQTQQPVPPAMDGCEGGSMGDGVAAVAATVAVCELLLAWDGGQEVIPAVFDPALCSSALNTAVAPVPQGLDPPVWLTVLRCLVESNRSNMIKWTTIHRHGGGVPQDCSALVAAASVWIGGGGPGAGGHHKAAENAHEAWIRWYGAKLGSLILNVGVASGKWLVLSGSTGKNMLREVKVHDGMGLVARTLTYEAWEYWGRSPLEAAWNIPAGLEDGAIVQGPPAILLPPFAVWLRIVLQVSGKGCSESITDGYMRRMAREVYLPCEFGGASSEMARQWLGALIESEVAAEARASDPAASERSAQISAHARRRAIVKAFFREELLRFGSGEAPIAPVGGPLTWLWPLEAVVSACGRAGPFGGGVLPSHHSADRAAEDTDGQSQALLDGPPSALARALSSIPHDLLCGSRRFGVGGGRPPPATLRAFATRAVDLAARALATPPCRHWSVARRLLLGLGLLYHALAMPAQSASDGKATSQSPSPAASRTVAIAGGNASVGKERPEAVAAQAAALETIESLLRISLGLGDADTEGASTDGVTGWQQRSTRLTSFKPGTSLLPTACRSLRPLEVGGRGGWEDYLQALRGAGAWRAAAALVKPWNVENLGPNPLSKSPAVRSRRSAAPAVARPQRQSLAAVTGADAEEVERPMVACETQRDSAVNVDNPTHESNGISLATRTCGAPCHGSADDRRQQYRGQGNGDALLSCPRASQASPVPAAMGQDLAHQGEVDSHDEKLAEAGQKESSIPRRTLRSTRRMGRSK